MFDISILYNLHIKFGKKAGKKKYRNFYISFFQLFSPSMLNCISVIGSSKACTYLAIPKFLSEIKPNEKMAINPFSFLEDRLFIIY
jgi:hypothetical protein